MDSAVFVASSETRIVNFLSNRRSYQMARKTPMTGTAWTTPAPLPGARFRYAVARDVTGQRLR